jgi:hypothetical protein
MSAILQMAAKTWHKKLPTYEMGLKSDNVEFVWYCGSHFENDNR